MNDHTNKDHPQLVHIKRIDSIRRQNSSNTSSISLHDEQMSSSPPMNPFSSMDKSDSQMSLHNISSPRSSLSNIFKVNSPSIMKKRIHCFLAIGYHG